MYRENRPEDNFDWIMYFLLMLVMVGLFFMSFFMMTAFQGMGRMLVR